jgi:REP element-mobilizing transposase RayT
MLIGSHLILHGYGHWFANDLRGSGSSEIREEKFEALGPIHFGRKRVQPPREELKEFWREAEALLKFEPLWFDDRIRKLIADSFAQLITLAGYTVWACAILKNHAHLMVRRHRDDPETICGRFAEVSRDAIRAAQIVVPEHPVWSLRPYKVYCNTKVEVIDRIDYVERNPEKEGLPPQHYDFVKDYDGWTPPKIVVVKKRKR